jgi:hypothetical protein
MLENRTAITTKASTNRAAMTNDPLVRADGRRPQGRRLRDLYRSYLASLGNPVDTGTGTQAAILTASELVVAAEAARTTLLAGEGDVDQVVRLENLAARALRRLGGDLRGTEASARGDGAEPPNGRDHFVRERAQRLGDDHSAR